MLTAPASVEIVYIEGNIGSGKSTLIRHLKHLSRKRDIIVSRTPFVETGSFFYQIKKTLYSIYCLYFQNYSFSQYLYNDHCESDDDDDDDIEFICDGGGLSGLSIRGKRLVFLEEPLDEWGKIVDPADGKAILQKFYDDQEKYAFTFQVMSLQTRAAQLRRAIQENPGAIIVSERSIYTDRDIFARMLRDNDKINTIEMEVYNLVFEQTRQILDGVKQRRIYLRSSPENTFSRKCGRARPGEEGVSIDYLRTCHEYHQKEFSNSDFIVDIDDYVVDTPKYSRLLRTLMMYF